MSPRDLSVSVVIPAFNEGRAVGDVVRGISETLPSLVREWELIVVDDGSTDGTAEAARKAGAVVLSHPVNKGYGQALRTGVNAARHEWILMTDADGSYPVSGIKELLPFAPDFDLIIGMREGAHFWGSPTRIFLRWVYLRMASFTVGEPVPDANSGLRMVRRSLAASTGPVECLGFSYSTTMTLSFIKTGRFVKFVPVDFSARVGQSKVRPARDILRTLQLMTLVLIAYNPSKLFTTLALFPAAAALAFGIAVACRGGRAGVLGALLCALGALQCFLAGCLLEALRMRSAAAARLGSER